MDDLSKTPLTEDEMKAVADMYGQAPLQSKHVLVERLIATIQARDAEIKELSKCDCGRSLSHGLCSVCDND